MTLGQWVTGRTSKSLIEPNEPAFINHINFIIKLCLYKIFVKNIPISLGGLVVKLHGLRLQDPGSIPLT